MNAMRRGAWVFMLALATLAIPAGAQDDPVEQLGWQKGPVTAKVGDQAELKVPEGYRFTGADGAKKFLELTQNVPSGDELGLLSTDDYQWFVIFSFEDTGYIKDDDKDSLNADELLSSIREGTEAANEERKSRGWSTMSVVGWIVKPHYEESTHNLEWSLLGRDDADQSEAANHHTRYLGRRGVMNAELVADTRDFERVLPEFREVMNGFGYTTGSDYRSFVQGDKVAEYGLGALVLGGAAAAAAKTGLLKSLLKMLVAGWKLVLAGIVALGAGLKKILSGRKPQEPEPVQDA